MNNNIVIILGPALTAVNVQRASLLDPHHFLLPQSPTVLHQPELHIQDVTAVALTLNGNYYQTLIILKLLKNFSVIKIFHKDTRLLKYDI